MREDYHTSIMDCPIPDEEETLMQFFDSLTDEEIEGYDKSMDDCKMMCIDEIAPCKKNWFPLAPLPKAVPCPVVKHDMFPEDAYYDAPNKKSKQEGNKPMRYNDNYASATAAITATKSDASVQREYFTSRLNAAEYPKNNELSTLFNMNVRTGPRTFVELIDMIKNDKFKINKKAQNKLDEITADGDTDRWYYDATYGIDWDGPKPDVKGYELALVEKDKQLTAARDTIMSGDAAAMKAAVEAFEAWTPTATTTAN